MKCYDFFKRALDLMIALATIIVASPVLLMIAMIIRLTSKGPAIFKQERAGKNATPFTFYKFRTMRIEADPYGASPKTGDDPRLTAIGKFLREYSLDELPQLFNVLMGQMSVVGPRPLYMAQIAEWNDYEKRRLEVKPGLTGLAQISGRGALTRETKLALDVEYVENKGMWTDIKIIFTTFIHVIGRKSIYEEKYSKTEHTRTSDQDNGGTD